VNAQFLFGDSDQQVGADGNPDLCFHRIGRVAVEGFDLQMLFDPLEKQLDRPALSIDFGDGVGWQDEIVGKEDEALVSSEIDEGDSAQSFGIGVGGFYSGQPNQLIAAYSRCFVGGTIGLHPSVNQILLGPHHEERRNLVDSVEPFEVVVSPIHGEDGTGLERDPVQCHDIVDFAGCQSHKAGDSATQIEQGMCLDCRLGLAKVSPWKDRQTQVDSNGVERKDSLIQVQREGLVLVEVSGTVDQMDAEVLIDQKVPLAVGIGQSRARDLAPETHPVEFVSMRMQTGLDVSQTIPARELGEGHREVLIPAGEVAHPTVSLISIDALVEFVTGDELEQLSKNGLLGHGIPRHVKYAGDCTPRPS